MNLKTLFRKKSISNVLANAAGEQEHALHKGLSVIDLTGFGIAAIIGAGIFTTIGKASADGGPGVIFLFLFTALACGFAAFAYAEFASMVPVSGSAYTYSYVAFGELIAWIIGWALIMEYAIGNVTVAIGWSEYFMNLVKHIKIGFLHLDGSKVPEWMTTDFISARNGFKEATALMNSGKTFENLDEGVRHGFNAYVQAPTIFGLPLICNVPALAITAFITWLVYRGIKESRNASNIMVGVKLSVVVLVIIAGSYYVNTDNWNPFLPNGIGGVLKGVSAVFFAYIGFDAISTTAEECKNPQRDLPRGMMFALIICTLLYVLISLVLTGMISYSQLNVADPLAHVFDKLNLKWMAGIIAVSAIFAMASVLLVFQLGQPRIWMSMSRDGLLPKRFAKVHPKFKTPSFSTIITGLIVGLGTLFLNIDMVTDLCSIGTLFAFVLVCGGVLKLSTEPNRPEARFKTPYINAKLVMPILLIMGISLSLVYNRENTIAFLMNEPKTFDSKTLITGLDENEMGRVRDQVAVFDAQGLSKSNGDLEAYMGSLDNAQYESLVKDLKVGDYKKYEMGWSLFRHKIPTWIFLIITLILSGLAWQKNLSLIPLLGLECCLYMMSELGYKNWMYFLIWLLLGLVIYFGYSIKNSKLRTSI
jgi:APA family basic amino acid/polyamine antiporter